MSRLQTLTSHSSLLKCSYPKKNIIRNIFCFWMFSLLNYVVWFLFLIVSTFCLSIPAAFLSSPAELPFKMSYLNLVFNYLTTVHVCYFLQNSAQVAEWLRKAEGWHLKVIFWHRTKNPRRHPSSNEWQGFYSGILVGSHEDTALMPHRAGLLNHYFSLQITIRV